MAATSVSKALEGLTVSKTKELKGVRNTHGGFYLFKMDTLTHPRLRNETL